MCSREKILKRAGTRYIIVENNERKIMSTPFTRRKTSGAFGSTRIKAVGHHYEVLMNEDLKQNPVPAPAGDAPARPNIANIFLEFSQPITEQAKGSHTALKGAFNVAQLLWNAFTEGEKEIAATRERLLQLPDATPEAMDELIKIMRERFEKLNAGLNLRIRSYELNFTKHGINLSLKTMPGSRVEGVQKTELSDIIR